MTERGKLFFDLVVAMTGRYGDERPASVIIAHALYMTNKAYDDAMKQGFVDPPRPSPPRPAPAPVTQSERGA